MSRETWSLIKKSKRFDVNVYRRGIVALIFSLMLSCVFCLLLFYIYLTEPERDFYATSGVAPPIKLNPMLSPNYSAQALLPPDPVSDGEDKLIPE
ncbi:Component of the Dot/Icm secretion system. inner membrane protein [Legionella sainthelensi]|uniref:IcmM (DotJ) n=1 Tax=Legionella sainthelensi TaxID=28087 RepID=A0A0W0YDT7_9GAMM|nr:type IVB secretion system protein IcmM/DotJ [Legionella sainthelensi]AUH70739.1 phosphoesterase [Legionella sainthelensi]KTD55045.1 IcmM (DotJ) [Legionella sainthelensi]VEB38148.1 Component of the Dot/Icm secretion system. inner membrane protein [Legionella sainthelensi]VEH36560.1 Component of the Dot/Icm secretion system. inner membrane protein [Legionella sainthelensi]